MTDTHQYHLQTGESGEAQLDNLDYFFGKQSRAFLTEIGLKKGMHVLDVGCGVGNLSCWIAQQVGDKGHVIDIDQAQIEVATKRAKKNQISNLTFEKADAHDLLQYKDQFDLAYCRWVLVHVKKPETVVKNVAATLHSKGILACEVGDQFTTRYHPEFPHYLNLRNKLTELLEITGNDTHIADHIFKISSSLKGFSFNAKLAQEVIYNQKEAKKYTVNFALVLDSMAPSLLKHDLMTKTEIEQVRDALLSHPIDENTVIYLARMTQIWCQKL